MNIRPLAVALMLLSLPGVSAAQQQDGTGSTADAVGADTRGWLKRRRP